MVEINKTVVDCAFEYVFFRVDRVKTWLTTNNRADHGWPWLSFRLGNVGGLRWGALIGSIQMVAYVTQDPYISKEIGLVLQDF